MLLDMEIDFGLVLVVSGCFMFYNMRIFREALSFNLSMQTIFEIKANLETVFHLVIITKY